MSKVVRTLLLAEGFFLFASGLLGPIWAVYVEKIGGDILEASGAFGTFMLTAALVTYFFSKIEDRQRHKAKFIIAGYLIGSVGFLGYLFVAGPISLFVVQAILGLTVAVKDPAYDGLFSRFAKRHLTLAWGEWEAMDYLTAGISAIIGGIIASFFGFKTLILIMVAFSLLGFLISLGLLHLKRLARA
jgi:MFS family permease